MIETIQIWQKSAQYKCKFAHISKTSDVWFEIRKHKTGLHMKQKNSQSEEKVILSSLLVVCAIGKVKTYFYSYLVILIFFNFIPKVFVLFCWWLRRQRISPAQRDQTFHLSDCLALGKNRKGFILVLKEFDFFRPAFGYY